MADDPEYNANREFTWDTLREALLHSAELGYVTLSCGEFYRSSEAILREGTAMVVRIDVDRSLRKALRMAKMMAQSQINATFFIRLHSPYYNVLSFESMSIVRSIQEMDFEIGLHCEPLDVAHVLDEPAEASFRRDVDILEALLGTEFRGVASHRNTSGINNIDFWSRWTPQEFGLDYEAYDSESLGLFQRSMYVSESGLDRWKCYRDGVLVEGDHRTLREHLDQRYPLLYVLLHPFVFRDRHYFEEM